MSLNYHCNKCGTHNTITMTCRCGAPAEEYEATWPYLKAAGWFIQTKLDPGQRVHNCRVVNMDPAPTDETTQEILDKGGMVIDLGDWPSPEDAIEFFVNLVNRVRKVRPIVEVT